MKQLSKGAQRELKDLKAGQVVDKGVTEESSAFSGVASALAGAAARSPLRGTAAQTFTSGVVGEKVLVTEIPIHTANNTPVHAGKHKRSEEPTGETPEPKALQTAGDRMDADIASPKVNLFGANANSTTNTSADRQQQQQTDSQDVMLQRILNRLDTLPTKTDFDNFKEEVRATVTEQVETTVGPLRSDYQQLKERVAALEKGEKLGPDPADPAFRQVAFLGFPDTASAQERLQAMEAFVQKFANHHPQVANNFYGPRNKRVLKPNGYAQFVDSDARDLLLKDAEGTTFTCKGKKVRVERGQPKFVRHRNYILGKKAKDILVSKYPGRAVEYKKQEKVRYLTVNAVVAFQQEPGDPEGTFVGEFSHLSLA